MTNTMTEETKKTVTGSGTMKIRAPQTVLTTAIDRVLNVVPQKTTMPALGHLFLEARKGEVTVTATDLDLTVTTAFAAEVDEEGSVALPAKRFSEIARQLDPQSDVALDVRKAAALITAGRANFRILGIGSDEFPKGQPLGFTKGISIPAELLRKAIQKTVFSVSRDETRRALTGVLWELSGRSMSMVGTDGHRLARISIPIELAVNSGTQIIVPTKTLNQALRLVSEAQDGVVQVKVAEDHLIFRFGGTSLFSRLIEGPFPRYQDVVPKDNDKKVVVKRALLTDALRRVSLLSDNLTHQARLTIKPDLLVLSAKTQDIGEAKEEVEIQYSGPEIDLAYNANYLAEILRNIESEQVLLSLGTPLNAGLVEPLEQGEDENYLCIIMPLRLVE
jgi:DNA polymerase-3 subunit beta